MVNINWCITYQYTIIKTNLSFKDMHILTLNTLNASSHTCIPLDSKTSTHPRY